MDRLAARVIFDDEVDVLPPKRENQNSGSAVVCLCCQKKRLASHMDADGCGICEECLAP